MQSEICDASLSMEHRLCGVHRIICTWPKYVLPLQPGSSLFRCAVASANIMRTSTRLLELMACICSCLGMEPLVMTYHSYIDQSKPFAEFKTWLHFHEDNVESDLTSCYSPIWYD